MLSLRHSIGKVAPLESLARNSKSVPHFRCYASPPRTEIYARLILLLALLLWRLMERAMRTYVDMTSTPLRGWDKKATERPTAFMMVTKFAGVIVIKLGHDRQLARPLSVVQQQYLTALDVPAACFTRPTG